MLLKLLPMLLISMFSASAYAQRPPIEPGVSRDLAIWRAARYSDVRYKLNLTLEKMSPVLKGTIEIRVNVSGDAPVAEARTTVSASVAPIILDWRKIKGSETLSTISNVSINGKTVESSKKLIGLVPGPTILYEESNEHLIFRYGVVAGENVIKLDFTSPILTSGSAITRYVDKQDGAEYIYSLFVPSDASTAFPVFDQPDLKARFTLDISAPSSWSDPITNTGMRDLPLNGRCFAQILSPPGECPRHYFFAETKPISTYVFAFAAGPWERVSSPTVKEGATRPTSNAEPSLTVGLQTPDTSIYVRKSQAEKFKPHAAETFRLMREGIKYLESYFDYKFPWPKYDLVLIPEFPFGGMEHAGATFVREQSIIFPTEPTKSDYATRATLIFHETAHQWFGDTVTMKWFDDLWLKEGFANFMAYKAMEKIMPEMNAWKVFYERIKQPAYATDSTKGTTPIYQPIKNLSAAKSAYGNIVYNKAPAFLRQAEFYLGEDKFQTAVRAFLKKHEFGNATWEDLVKEFELAPGGNQSLAQNLTFWAQGWVKGPGVMVVHTFIDDSAPGFRGKDSRTREVPLVQYQPSLSIQNSDRGMRPSLLIESFIKFEDGSEEIRRSFLPSAAGSSTDLLRGKPKINFIFPNYRDYGYGIFLLDDKSRDYVLKNIGSEKDDFLRAMMWGSLWDSVREGELAPKDYVELVVKNLSSTPEPSTALAPKPATPPNQGGESEVQKPAQSKGIKAPGETDESTIATLLARVSTAMNYYLSDAQRGEVAPRLETVLIDRMQHAPTLGQRITFYRAFLNIASTENARSVLKQMLLVSPSDAVRAGSPRSDAIPLKTKDRFDIVARLAILGDPDEPELLAELEKTETSDDAKRYAYAAHAAFATKENREKFWTDFVTNKQISESWIEAAMGPFNSIRHDDLSLPYLQRALAELPNLKRDRKIFFVNGWLGAFIGGQKNEQALAIVNKFLADNSDLDNDLRLKILENVDLIERAVRIRGKYGK
jgi:aminopeptidase N